MQDMADLNGKTAIVTGASRGIGAATARALAEAGASVVLAARAMDQIEEVARGIRHAGGRTETVRCDVSRWADVKHAVEICRESFGRVDILVNNAGTIEPIGHLVDSDPATWGHATDVNFKGAYHGLRAALPLMKAQGSGTVVNISSGAAHGPLEGWSHYCGAKAGAYMLTRMADLECRESGVTIVGLSPGTVATDMQRAIKGSGINKVSELDWSDHVPPEWPAKAVLWLCGPAGQEHAGQDVKLGDIRAELGLPVA